MTNPKIPEDCSTIANCIAPFSCTPLYKNYIKKSEVVHPTSGKLGLGLIFNTHPWKFIAKHMINLKFSVDWSTTNPIALLSCTPRVQVVYTKSEVVHHTPGQLGLGVLYP